MGHKFNELEFEQNERKITKENFLRHIYSWEKNEVARLKRIGWKYVKTMRRTVVFTIGEVTLQRKVLLKDGVWKKPLDDYLNLSPNAQYSPEALLLLLETYVDLSTRKTGYHLSRLKGMPISKDAVLKARKKATQLYKERQDYEDYQDEKIVKRKVKQLYIEGDGIWLREQKGGKKMSEGSHGFELAHFVVHEGSEVINGDKKLVNKHNVVNCSNLLSREQLQDYIHKYYEITPDTILITNSDMGVGYSVSIFNEIAKFLRCKHEHFYDNYHVKQLIKQNFRFVPHEDTDPINLEKSLFEAIKAHNKSDARVLLDTASSKIINDSDREKFEDFSRTLINKFKYTKSPKLRGLNRITVGIMESQQSMIADRTKHRKMSWSRAGGETIAQLIIDVKEKRLRELFLGEWRAEWKKIQDMPPVADYIDIATRSHDTTSPGHLPEHHNFIK